MTGLQPGAATMTVLFTDLVDSTAMRSRIGDDQADDVRREHDELITRLVDENRGSIVKGLGDGIMAVFGAPSSGIAAAVGIQQAIARRNRQARVPIALRMGLSVGEVRVESDDVYGTPVVEASRLCGAAGADQILTAEHVKLLAGSRSTATYRDFGELELKGLSEPLRTLEVLWWEASDAPSIPFPELPALDTSGVFVGRSVERYAIGHAWLNARTAKAPVVFITGPAGVGKTRLVAEFARRTTQSEGGLVLYGRCTEGGGPAFQPFAEAIRYYVSNVPSGQLADLLGAHAGELARVVPELAEQMPGATRLAAADTQFEQVRLFDAVAGWLAAASRDEPMVLILDDLQWASRSTLDMLQHVADSTTPMRVLIVALATNDADGDADALEHVRAHVRTVGRGVEPIELRGLSEDDVADLLTGLVGDLGDAAAVLGARVHERTAGNPLYGIEIGRGLVKAGILSPGEGGGPVVVKGDPAGLALPPSLDTATTALVAVLGNAAVQVLQPASVAGDEFDLGVVRALAADLDDETFNGVIDAATNAGLLVELPGARQRLAFAHTAQQHALLATVDAERRGAWHRQIVTEIERLAGADADRYVVDLARHQVAAAAGGGDVEAAIAACTRVAEQARDQLAVHDAVIWYRHAVELLEPAGDDARLLPLVLALGEAEHQAGLDEARATLLRAAGLAQELGDEERLVAAVVANVPVYTGRPGPFDAERVAALRAAVAATGDAPPGVRARVLALLASELVWATDAGARFTMADDALGLARELDDPRVLAGVLALRVPTIDALETLDERRALSEELFELAGALEDPVLRLHAALHRATAAGEVGDLEAYDHWLGLAAVIASGLDLPLTTWLVAAARASRAYLAGDLVAAERHADEARTAGLEAARPEAELTHTAVLVAVRRLQGRIDEVTRDLDVSTSSARTDGFGLCRAVADAGRIEEAEPRYRDEAAGGFVAPRQPGTGAALANLAYLAALLGDTEGAEVLYGKLEPHAEHFTPAPVFQHVGAHYLGMLAATLGRTDDADRWFERAVERHEQVDAPLLGAETKLEWARVCYGTGNVERARELLGQALAAAVKGRATGLEQQAHELLNAAFGGGDERPGEAVPAAAPAAAEPEAVEEPVAVPVAAPGGPFVVPPLPPVPPPPAPIPVYRPAAAATPPPPPS